VESTFLASLSSIACPLTACGKVTLTPSAYLHAVGQIVDDALFRVMDDVLSLEDIHEADSERLSDLCEMLAPLEELFTDIPGEVRRIFFPCRFHGLTR
jgi:hypothetical protein